MEKRNIYEYKGYHTQVEFDAEDLVLRGKIEGISDLIYFECSDVSRAEQEFHEAVDDYLEFCEEVEKNPDKEYKGSFNVRISPALHRQLAVLALKNGDSLNASVEKAIEVYVSGEEKGHVPMQDTFTIPSGAIQNESKFTKGSAFSYSNVVQFENINMKYAEEE